VSDSTITPIVSSSSSCAKIFMVTLRLTSLDGWVPFAVWGSFDLTVDQSGK
jgi:hypothetical protein